MRKTALLIIALVASLPTVGLISHAVAETATQDMSGMMMQAPEGASDATKGYVDAMNRMSMAMTADFTGDADRDFIIGMIPHHKGAVEAARIVLQHGSDPEVKAFAQAIIAAQEAEIAWMTEWLVKNGN